MKINLKGFFEDKKLEIIIKLKTDIYYLESIILALHNKAIDIPNNFDEYKAKIDKHEMKIIRLKELIIKISNINEEI